MSQEAAKTPKHFTFVRATLAGVIILAIGAAVTWNSHRRSPEYAVAVVHRIRSLSEINARKDYFTEQGLRISKAFCSFPQESQQIDTFGKPEIVGDRMSVEVSNAKDTSRWCFVRNGVWQLDDIVYSRIEDHPWHARLSEVAEPLRALFAVSSLKTAQAIDKETHYLTAKGKKVLKYSLAQSSTDSSGRPPIPKMEDPIVTGQRVMFPYSLEDGTRVSMVIVKNDEWQYDDMILERIEGRDVNLSFAYKIDHPIMAWAKTVDVENFEKLAETFATWFAIGYKAARLFNEGQ